MNSGNNIYNNNHSPVKRIELSVSITILRSDKIFVKDLF
jgi:hypothetical protein